MLRAAASTRVGGSLVFWGMRVLVGGLLMILLAGTGLGLRNAAPAAARAPAEDAPLLDATVADTAGPVALAPAAAPAPAPAEYARLAAGPLASDLPTPKEAPAAAVFDDMKHVWQS